MRIIDIFDFTIDVSDTYYDNINSFYNEILLLNEIYELKSRKIYDQIKISDEIFSLIINKFNFDEPYLNLTLKHPIYLTSNNFYLIRGKSGSGKSTFLSCLRNIIDVQKENYEILLNDKIIEHGFKSLSDNIYYVDQFNKLYNSGTIYDIIKNFNKDDNDIFIDELINNCDLTHLNDKIIDPEKLSGGENHRLNICKTLYQCKMSNKRIIVMDEIDSSIDSKTNLKIVNYIKNNMSNYIILYITHDDILDTLNLPTIHITDGIISQSS
jgi:ABC-type lipoprotein export system ATPase subunit